MQVMSFISHRRFDILTCGTAMTGDGSETPFVSAELPSCEFILLLCLFRISCFPRSYLR
jgi:hypothetical protein